MSRKRRGKSTVAVPWRVHLDSIRHRYPYKLPPPVKKERHFNKEGVDPTCVAYKGPRGQTIARRKTRHPGGGK